MKEKSLIYILLLIVALLITINLIQHEKRYISKETKDMYEMGDIRVNTKTREIHFTGKVYKNEGWVQFLLYAHGYKWLKEESAIVCGAKLADLQKAIAMLDYKIWDDLWFGRKTKRTKKLVLLLEWKEGGLLKRSEVGELVKTADPLWMQDLIFLGSPYFDGIALEASPATDCARCPIFSMEQKVLKEEFKRESGQSGYELNSSLLPPKGTEVTIIIMVGYGKGIG